MLTLPWDNPVLPGFIVFEGLDGAGTTTQAQRLHRFLDTEGEEAVHTWEPTDFLTGKTIRALLHGPEFAEPWTLALLFAADRYEHLHRPDTGILSNLKAGKVVVSDRYLFSSLAYQGSFADFSAVESLNHQFPLPEHLIFIDTPRDTALQRLATRKTRDSLEHESVQVRAEYTYRGVISDFERAGRIQVHRIDGDLDVETISGQIREIFRR
jgi:dTMP kinase